MNTQSKASAPAPTTRVLVNPCEDCGEREVSVRYEDCGCLVGWVEVCLRCAVEYELYSDRGLCDYPNVEFI